METYSSGEELLMKTRKPYTITKQRERWTEEEHNRFLEALKLYGRAWQRIEEHIGTKTAVQIRSHAQKFFTKLEKEALSKGVPIGQTLDINIPPPRPKRKPSNPYPRKINIEGLTPHVGGKEGKLSGTGSSLPKEKDILDSEKEPLPEKSSAGGRLDNVCEGQNHNSEIFNIQVASCTSKSSPTKNYMLNSVKLGICSFREFVPSLKESINKDETSIVIVDDHGGHQNLEADGSQSFHENDTFKILKVGNEKLPQDKMADEGNPSENLGCLQSDEQGRQYYPRHVPVHILEESLRMNATNTTSCQESILHNIGGLHGHQNKFGNPTSSVTSEHPCHAPRSSVHQSFSNLHPVLNPVQNQDEYRAFLHSSSTFSSLIVSSLLQNPAAHAAASFAATFWPCANTEAPPHSGSRVVEGFPSPQLNATPSMTAIAAATVAAATAWWAAHGLLPLCAPFHTSLSCPPAFGSTTTPIDTSHTRAGNSEIREATLDNTAFQGQQLGPQCSEALQEQQSASKSPSLATSDSEESEGAKHNTGQNASEGDQTGKVTELHDTNNLKSRKQVDRSSCGSNTPSSSEIETDALEKQEKGKEESKEHDANPSSNDFNNRRGRSLFNTNDYWKEVSEEGRLAFQALFFREVLPQSFSPPQDLKNKHTESSDDARLQPHLYGKLSGGYASNQVVEDMTSFGAENDKTEEGLLMLGLGNPKLKARRTGFKPYKRCSVEAKESKVPSTTSHDEEKGPKRLRVEGQVST